MNYGQFIRLTSLLENNGNDLRKELGLREDAAIAMSEKDEDEKDAPKEEASKKEAHKKPDNVKSEDPGELEIEETKLQQFATRWGRMKNTINGVGKKTQQHLTENIVKKYFPKVLDVERQMFQKIKQSGDTDSTQLKDFVLKSYSQIQGQQRKQIEVIENAITKYLKTTTASMEKKINGSKMNDTNKLVLNNYWNLLSTQIFMNLSLYMVSEREKIIDAIFANDKAMAEEVKKRAMAEERKKAAAIQKKAKEEEAKVKDTEKKIEKAAGKEEDKNANAKDTPNVKENYS